MKNKKSKTTISWLLQIETDSKTGDKFIVLPDGLTNPIGWVEDDSILWEEQTDGSWKLSKIKKY